MRGLGPSFFWLASRLNRAQLNFKVCKNSSNSYHRKLPQLFNMLLNAGAGNITT